jgi:hypothetical protein
VTRVITFRVLLREGEEATEYTLERTYRGLVAPTPVGGPYLSQEGDTFFVDEVARASEFLRGWCASNNAGARDGRTNHQ